MPPDVTSYLWFVFLLSASTPLFERLFFPLFNYFYSTSTCYFNISRNTTIIRLPTINKLMNDILLLALFCYTIIKNKLKKKINPSHSWVCWYVCLGFYLILFVIVLSLSVTLNVVVTKRLRKKIETERFDKCPSKFSKGFDSFVFIKKLSAQKYAFVVKMERWYILL